MSAATRATLALPRNAQPLINARRSGVKKEKHARHLIRTIMDELSPLRGTSSAQGPKESPRVIPSFLPIEPTDEMIDASMATVTNFDVTVSKREKHRLRLRAAIKVAMEPLKKSRRTP